MNLFRSDLDLKLIFNKLGHPLEEIRVRTLNNLLSKLEHRLIVTEDLIHERHLLIRLIEWFNFPQCPQQQEVLGLLVKLLQHSAAVEILLSVGAVEFFTELRTMCEKRLHGEVDRVLEALMVVSVPRHVTAPCVYHGLPGTFHDRSNNTSHDTTAVTDSSATTVGHMSVTGSSDMSSQYESYQVPSGYYYYTRGDVTDTTETPGSDGGVTGAFRITVFAWLPLTYTDRRVLSSTNASLNSQEPSLLVNACEFLSDVVFLDFPAEVFLQRPSIIQSLLRLVGGGDSDPSLTHRATLTLTQLTKALANRIRFHIDPSFYSPKQDFGSTTTSFSSLPSHHSSDSHASSTDGATTTQLTQATRYRGDGQDRDTSDYRTLPLEEVQLSQIPDIEDHEELQTLQLSQHTVPQYCLMVLQHCLPMLRSTNGKLLSATTTLISSVVELLVGAVSPDVWADNSPSARDFSDKMIDILECYADLVSHHHHRGDDPDRTGSKWPLSEVVGHRHTFVWLSETLATLLPPLIPLDKAKLILPESLGSALSLVVFDESLAHVYPDVRRVLIGYLKRCEPIMYRVYEDTAAICESGYRSCKLLADVDVAGSEDADKYVILAQEALPSLPYHRHLGVVERFLHYVSVVCKKKPLSQHRDVLLQLLSHPVEEIRHVTYRVLHNIVTSSLDVESAVSLNSTEHHGVKFLMDPHILNQILAFGFNDSAKHISEFARGLVARMLASEVVMGAELWAQLVATVTPIMAVLQCFVGDEKMGEDIAALTRPEHRVAGVGVPMLERLRGSLRYMYSPYIKTRSENLKHLAWFLTSQHDSTHKLPLFSSLDVTNLSDLLLVDHPRPLDPDPPRHSVFTPEGIRKVFGIFSSPTVDSVVKKSALDQLAIMMQDHTLHHILCDTHGLDVIMELIHTGLQKTPDSHATTLRPHSEGYMLPAVTIIHHIILHDTSRRRDMAHDMDVYLTLLRVALLLNKQPPVTQQVSRILALLLFDEVTSFTSTSEEKGEQKQLSLPQLVTEKYRLPFTIAVHLRSSPHVVAMPTEPDPLRSASAAEMIRVAWNVAWHYGMDDLVVDLQHFPQPEDNKDFSAAVTLSPLETLLLRATHYKTGIAQCLGDITNATSHEGVMTSLLSLQCYLTQLTVGKILAEDVWGEFDWFEPFVRYLSATPSTSPDEELLANTLQCISLLIESSNQIPQQMSEFFYQSDGLLHNILSQSNSLSQQATDESFLSIKRNLDSEMLTLISTVASTQCVSSAKRSDLKEPRGHVVHLLMLRLNVSEVPQFYNLASLEGTLQCLRHATAREGWSIGSLHHSHDSLTLQLLHSLLAVLSAFHVGRGGTSMSYMGRGVTRAAAVCLHHLAYEMSRYADNDIWCHDWLYSHQSHDDVSCPSLNWLINLWLYRDPEVRLAGMGIACALASTQAGCTMITQHWGQVAGGMWGTGLSVMLDHAECALVRCQAVLLLVNLSSRLFDTHHPNPITPVVEDTELQVSLTDLPALLQHRCFYTELAVMIRSHHPQCIIHPAVAAMSQKDVTYSSAESQATLTTLDTERSMPYSGLTHIPASSLHPQVYTSTPTHQSHSLVAHATRQSHSSTSHAISDSTPRLNGTSSSTASSCAYHSLATPALISASLQLLNNLVCLIPQEVTQGLLSHDLPRPIRALLDLPLLDTFTPHTCPHTLLYRLTYSDLIKLYTSILSLTRVAVSDESILKDTCKDSTFLSAVLAVVARGTDDNEATKIVSKKLLVSAFDCLSTLLIKNRHAIDCALLTSKWHAMAECVETCIKQTSPEHRDVRVSSLTFLTAIFSSVDANQSPSPERIALLDSDVAGTPSGSALCHALVGQYEAILLKPADVVDQDEKIVTIGSLRALLAVSTQAKTTALDAGLIERLIDHVQHTISDMHLLHVTPITACSTHRKEIQETTSSLEVLHSIMYRHHNAKVAAQHSGLGGVCQRLWSLALSHTPLMTSILSLLLTFTAHCPSASSSLAYTSMAGDAVPLKPSLSHHSLIHCVIKLCQCATITKHNRHSLKLAFHLLATLALTHEARSVFYKSNFLNKFSELKPWQPQKSKVAAMRECLWLRLLVNLSFCTDGQQMILKLKDSLKLLLEYAKSNNPVTQELSTLVLRNLCFHASNKPKMLSNGELVLTFLRLLECGCERSQVISASALWALVHNNQKAKVAMKNANVVSRIKSVISQLSRDSLPSERNQFVTNLSAVVATVTDQS